MIRRVFRSIRFLIVLAILALGAFVFRDEISSGISSLLNRGGEQIVMAESVDQLRPDVVEQLRPGSREPLGPDGDDEGVREVIALTPEEVALSVEATFYDIANGRGDREIRISEAELQLYVQHRLVVPAGVENLAIDLRDSTAAVSASLDFASLEIEPQAVENLRRFMGDSAKVSGEVYGKMIGPGDGRLIVLSLQAGVVPVPPFLVGLAVGQFGLETDEQGIKIPLIEDIIEIRVENEEVIIIRDR